MQRERDGSNSFAQSHAAHQGGAQHEDAGSWAPNSGPSLCLSRSLSPVLEARGFPVAPAFSCLSTVLHTVPFPGPRENCPLDPGSGMHRELQTPVGPLVVLPYPATQTLKQTHTLPSAASEECLILNPKGTRKVRGGSVPNLE